MICPRCGNNDVTDPEVCPKCHTVLKVNNEKIGAKSQWSTKDYVIKKEKDVNTNKEVFIMVFLIVLIGVVIAVSLKFDLFNGEKKIELKDAIIYVNNINSYIASSNRTTDEFGNKIVPKYKVNKVEYDFVSVPSSKKCIYINGEWDNSDCELFMNDVKNYCKGNGSGCVMDPVSATIAFENNKVKNGSTMKFNDIECTYNLVDTKNISNTKNVKCHMTK